MEQIVLNRGTKDERTYTLDLDFNAIADTDVMTQFTNSLSIVKDMRPKEESKLTPQDHKKRGRKPAVETLDDEQIADNIEQMSTFMPAIQKLFVSTRAILHACLQCNHEDEFPTLKETGRLINDMLKSKDESGKSEWDILAVFTLAQNALTTADSLAGLLGGAAE